MCTTVLGGARTPGWRDTAVPVHFLGLCDTVKMPGMPLVSTSRDGQPAGPCQHRARLDAGWLRKGRGDYPCRHVDTTLRRPRSSMRWPKVPERFHCGPCPPTSWFAPAPTSTCARIPRTGADCARRWFGPISAGSQCNGGGCTTDDCGAHVVANPCDAQLNSSRTTAKPTNRGGKVS